jgi:hypothetical protein
MISTAVPPQPAKESCRRCAKGKRPCGNSCDDLKKRCDRPPGNTCWYNGKPQ